MQKSSPKPSPKHAPASSLPSPRPDPASGLGDGALDSRNFESPETYPPPEAFRRGAYVKSMDEYTRMYRASLDDPEKFWGDEARKLHWEKPFSEVGPFYNFSKKNGPISIEWFRGGKTNVCFNCLDRIVDRYSGSRTALYYEGNDASDAHRRYTYQEVLDLVSQLANGLRAEKVAAGDRVSVYLHMAPELLATMLACSRIGSVHSVVFGGFAADAFARRICDAESRVVVTADGVMRGPKPIQLKAITDKAVELCASYGFTVERVICVKRLGGTSKAANLKHEWHPERDVWFHDFVAAHSTRCDPEWMDSEDNLFLLYTSGSSGKPKGVLHTTGGYMVGAHSTMLYSFDYHPEDVFYCTADCGWITGHTYITYGPMLAGATQVVFEGVPYHPSVGRYWHICEKYKVTTFYTAPTAIRALMQFGGVPVKKYDLSKLRLLATTGDILFPDCCKWLRSTVGSGRCPVSDNYWQTETGGHALAPLCGAMSTKPGSTSLPCFGVELAVLDEYGNELHGACSGNLVIKKPSPSMMRAVFKDRDRFEETYFSQHDGYYFTGDGCRRDADGCYWLTGRIDDVINVSGHRIDTREVETALTKHQLVAEAAAVGFPHVVKGEGIWCYVTLKDPEAYRDSDRTLKDQLKQQVRDVIGPFAQPDEIHWAPRLPKTRSGKVLRRVLRKLALPDYASQDMGDLSTLQDGGVIELLKRHHPRRAAQGLEASATVSILGFRVPVSAAFVSLAAACALMQAWQRRRREE